MRTHIILLLMLILVSCTNEVTEDFSVYSVESIQELEANIPQVQPPIKEDIVKVPGKEIIVTTENPELIACPADLKYYWEQLENSLDTKSVKFHKDPYYNRYYDNEDLVEQTKITLNKETDESFFTTKQRTALNKLRTESKRCMKFVMPKLPTAGYDALHTLNPTRCEEMRFKQQREIFNAVGTINEREARAKREIVDYLCKNI